MEPGEPDEHQPVPRPAKRRPRAKGGRPNKNTIRYTDVEQARIADAAAAAGMSVPHWIAETTLTAAAGGGAQLPVGVRRSLSEELSKIARLLEAIGNNLNQLVKAYHSTGRDIPQHVAATTDRVNRGMAEVETLAAWVRPWTER